MVEDLDDFTVSPDPEPSATYKLRQTAVTTIKIISPRIFGALVGLAVLWVTVPNALADDATDWANWQAQIQKEREEWYNQQAQAQTQRDEWYNQQAQAQRDREQAEKDRKEREDWQNQIAKDQKEREEWYNQQAQAQKEREDWLNQQAQAQREVEQAQKERDLNEYLNQIWKQSEEMGKWAEEQARARQEEINQAGWAAPAAPPPAAVLNPLAGQAAPQLQQPEGKQPPAHNVTIYNGSQVTRTTFVMDGDGLWHASDGVGIDTVTPAAIPQPAPLPFDPAAFHETVRRNQERVRQQILQTQQRILQRSRR
jgi:hypothetical protein